jgi:hypothetical protein
MSISNQDEKDKDETGEGGGFSGASGEIEFRYKDIYATAPRDDILPDSEIKRLLTVHRDLHKDRVDKQKMTRKERLASKEGRLHHTRDSQHGLGMGGGGGASNYKKHPISDRAQFSGVDRQVAAIPTQYEAETNLELSEKLENRFVLKNAPKFNPKPRPM